MDSAKDGSTFTVKLTADEFKKMAQLIYDRTGIYLPESKLGLLSNRLRKRLRVLSLDGFKAYYELLLDERKCKDELPYFLSAVTTNETYFFRNPNLWKFFRETWIPEVSRQAGTTRHLRLWSAASSSGEEAYTAAICLRERLPNASQWKLEIIGTDISQRMLDHARTGVYNEYAVGRMEPATLKRWFRKDGESYHIRDDLKSIVDFRFHNLRDVMAGGKFDFVFLRNVLMYFDNAMKIRVIRNVENATRPGGRVYVGDVDPIRSTPALRDEIALEYSGPNLYLRPQLSASSA